MRTSRMLYYKKFIVAFLKMVFLKKNFLCIAKSKSLLACAFVPLGVSHYRQRKKEQFTNFGIATIS